MMKRMMAILIPASILILLTGLVFVNPVWLQIFRFKGFDLLHQSYPRTYDEELPVSIIDIDEESLSRYGQWPWPRNIMAEMLQKLHDSGASAVGLDIVFAEPDRSSPAHILRQWAEDKPQWKAFTSDAVDYDQQLAETMAQGPDVTGFVMTNDRQVPPVLKKDFIIIGNDPLEVLDDYSGAVSSLPPFSEAASGNGALNSLPDRDGLIRRIPLVFRSGEHLYPSLVAELLRVAQGNGSPMIKTVGAGGAQGEADVGMENNILSVRIGQFTIPTNKAGDFFVHYTPYTHKRYIPAWQLLSPEFDASKVEGKIVLIGTSAAGLKDIRATPMNQLTSGVEIHAQALEQVLAGNYISRPDWLDGVEALGLFVLGIVLIICMNLFSALWGAVLCLMIMCGSLGGAAFAFTHFHLMLDTATPAVALLIIYMSESLRRYIITERERREIRHAFVHYMSPALVEKLAANPEALKLGGETRNMTILFCDIRGFTTLSEMYNAEELTRFLNRFLTPMTEVILSHNGTIDKYMGDAIMAFWNAPLDEPQHAVLACRAALGMLSALAELNARRQVEAEEAGHVFLPVQIGIGLNSGDCCVGNMGSDQRFDYSVLGDDVNLASRLEGQSKFYGVSIIIGERTHAKLSGLATLELDLIRVKGKTAAVRIYSLIGDEAMAADPAFIAMRASTEAMLASYLAMHWAEAQSHLERAENQAAAMGLKLGDFFALYRDRLEEFTLQSPSQPWSGVYEAKTK